MSKQLFDNLKQALDCVNSDDLIIRKKARKLCQKALDRSSRKQQKEYGAIHNCGLQQTKEKATLKNLKYLSEIKI